METSYALEFRAKNSNRRANVSPLTRSLKFVHGQGSTSAEFSDEGSSESLPRSSAIAATSGPFPCMSMNSRILEFRIMDMDYNYKQTGSLRLEPKWATGRKQNGNHNTFSNTCLQTQCVDTPFKMTIRNLDNVMSRNSSTYEYKSQDVPRNIDQRSNVDLKNNREV